MSPQEKTTEVESDSDALKQPDEFSAARKSMVEDQLAARDITDQRVLDVMSKLPREKFVLDEYRHVAYGDNPLPIGHDQTISQPYIVALMTQLAQVDRESVVLDIGTGSGYQAAVLAELGKDVYSIEIINPLAVQASARLKDLGYDNIQVRSGDGYQGWPEHAPFDAIIVAAAPDHVPLALVEQLKPGGRLIIPVGQEYQELLVIEKQDDGSTDQRSVIPVRFVPMTGQAQKQSDKSPDRD